jgi:hypothetical protein
MNAPTRRSRFMLVTVAVTLVALAAYGIWSQRPHNSNGVLRRITIAQFGDFFLYAPTHRSTLR